MYTYRVLDVVFLATKDIENAYFTLMWQLLQKADPALPMPEDAAKIFQKCAEDRDAVIAEIGLRKTEGKRTLLEVVSGGAVPSHLVGNPILVSLRSACIWLKWLAVPDLQDLYSYCEGDKSKPVPDNSVLAYLYQAIEDIVLSSWVEYLTTLNLTHLSLHFDGCRVQGPSLNIEELCNSSATWIAQETGFVVRIKEKKTFVLLGPRDPTWEETEQSCDPVFHVRET